MQQPASGIAYLGYVFGAFGAESVPGPCLIDLLLELGLTEPAVRTMLSRQTRAGQLASIRHGRVAVYRLTGSYRERFLRIRQADEPVPWQGRFRMIMYDIAESRRRDRDALRERAAAAGFGAPRPGVLIGFADPAEWAKPWLERGDLFVRIGELSCTVDTAAELAQRAWPLTATAPKLRRFVTRLEQIRRADTRQPAPAAQAFRTLGKVMHDYAGLYRGTPNLPNEITPSNWPGHEVSTVLSAVSGLLGARVSEHARATAQQRGLTELIEPLATS